MKTMRRNRLLAFTLMAGLASACETGTDPDKQAAFDAEAALQDYEAMDAVLASGTMEGFRVMAGAVSFETFGPGPEVALEGATELLASARELAPGGEENARAFAMRMVQVAERMTPQTAMDPLISSFHRGKTFAYDPDLGRYAVDPERTEAPRTGVRIILYEPGPDGKPDVEREIGHADLIDRGDGSAEEVSLELVVVVDGTRVLEYRTTIDVVADGGKITVDGFIQGQYDRLDFDIDVQGSEKPGEAAVDIDFEMRIDNRDFVITGSVDGLEHGESGRGEIQVMIRHGNQSLRVELSGKNERIEGAVYLNDNVFATVSGPADDPTFLGATGEPLTGAEWLVVLHVVDIVEDVFDLFEDLMEPIAGLVILAVLL
jgi:hypothetical protein